MIFGLRILLLIVGLGNCFSTVGFGESTWNEEIRFYRLLFFPIKDNVEGSYAKPVEETVRAYLTQQQRFDLIDAKAISQIGPDRPDTTLEIELKSTQEEKGIIEITFKSFPGNKVLLQDKRTVTAFKDLDSLEQATLNALDDVIGKIPFHGTISQAGDDEYLVAINGPRKVKPGQIMDVYEIQNVVLHPLLKTIVDLKLSKKGSLVATSGDQVVVFAKLKENDEGTPAGKTPIIMEGDKVILLPPTQSAQQLKSEASATSVWDKFQGKQRYGSVQFFSGFGRLNNRLSQDPATTPKLINPSTIRLQDQFVPGFGVAADFVLTRKINLLGNFQKNIANLVDDIPNTGGIDHPASLTQLQFAADYRLTPFTDENGPNLFIGAGLDIKKLSCATNASIKFSEKRYRGIGIRFRGDTPLGRKVVMGGSLTTVFLNSVKEDPEDTSGTSTDDENVEISVFGGYKMADLFRIDMGLNYVNLDTTYSSKIRSSIRWTYFWIAPRLTF